MCSHPQHSPHVEMVDVLVCPLVVHSEYVSFCRNFHCIPSTHKNRCKHAVSTYLASTTGNIHNSAECGELDSAATSLWAETVDLQDGSPVLHVYGGVSWMHRGVVGWCDFIFVGVCSIWRWLGWFPSWLVWFRKTTQSPTNTFVGVRWCEKCLQITSWPPV